MLDVRYSTFISFFSLILLDARGQRLPPLSNYISKAGVDFILDYFAFVGWVEPTPSFVGFRCTQPNLHLAGAITKCETQQRPISEPNPKCFFSDQTGLLRPTAVLA